jgi:hypothetical protein
MVTPDAVSVRSDIVGKFIISATEALHPPASYSSFGTVMKPKDK